MSSISDKFGRKYPLFICGFLCCIFNFASAFAPTFWVFALCRGITGFMIGKYVYQMKYIWSRNLRESGPAGWRNWKQRFISKGLPSTLICSKMELFENALQTGGIWKRWLWFWCGKKTFWKRTFRKRLHHDNHANSLSDRIFLKHKSKMTDNCFVFKFFWIVSQSQYLALSSN